MTAQEKFIKEREDRYEGKVSFLSFAKYIGSSREAKLKNLSGIIYVINKNLYFEDFKPNPPLIRIGVDRSDEYEKTEFSIPLDSLLAIKKVTEKDCEYSIKSRGDFKKIPEVTSWLKDLFNKSVSMFQYQDSADFFFVAEVKKLEECINNL